MEVIPAINCATKECATQKLREIKTMGATWAHIDVTDGVFSETPTLRDAKSYENSGLFLEAHLMVAHPELVYEEWLAVGVRRIVVHVESFLGRDSGIFNSMVMRCKERGVELMLSENPHTAVQELFGYADFVNSFQLLAVLPGLSGQTFNEEVISKIKTLKEFAPNAVIEIDGGVNLDVARRVRDAGATHIVSASFIFDNADSHSAFRALQTL